MRNYSKPKLKKLGIRFILISYFVAMLSFIGFHVYYADKILPNIYVNDIAVGGLTFEEAQTLLAEKLKSPEEITLKIKDHEAKVSPTNIEFEFLPVATAKKAFYIGRTDSFSANIKSKALSILNTISLAPEYKYNSLSLRSFLNLAKIEALDEYLEPTYVYENDEVKILAGKSGETFDEAFIEKEIIKRLVFNLSPSLEAEVSMVNPTLSMQDLTNLKIRVDEILAKDYSLIFNDYKWELDKATILSFLQPVKKSVTNTVLIANKSVILDKLNEIAEEVNRNPRGQVLEVENGKAVQFVSAENGLRLVVKDSYDAIEKGLLDGQGIDSGQKEIALAVEVSTPPEIDNEYKIEDVLGVGHSKFRGSDAGRMHNIKTASEKVSGILVEPGGVFSFVEAVGPINRDAGFTSAKVISGVRTVLGDGGGVCQVSTTIFRAALNAGLPILERNAHSYRVGYYEQDSEPGLDATIYSPSVDFTFKNDTDGYILVTSNFNQSEATLDFTIYGKSDGRTVEITKPKMLSQTPPPETRNIEDGSLPKGVKKLQENAIWGAVVTFDRTVKKGDEVLYDDTFKSVYRAWGAVYLVGTAE